MKKVLVKILIFSALVVAVDFLIGLGMGWVHRSARGGETLHFSKINRAIDEDIVVFGSSRAFHHYNSALLDSLTGRSVYNAGYEAMGIVLAYMELSNILEQGHRPSLVLYDFFSYFDYIKGDNTKYLLHMRPFYGENPAVDSVFAEVDQSERLKMLSRAYRYNGRVMVMLNEAFSSKIVYEGGFLPEDGTITANYTEPTFEDFDTVEDPLKVKYLQKFIELCRQNDIPVVFVLSPYYFESRGPLERGLIERALPAGIPVLDFATDTAFVGRKDLFTDPNHLNRAGADIFTRRLAERLSKLTN